MASWHQIEIIPENPFPKEKLDQLNAALQVLDYDFPPLGEQGITLAQEVSWRSPTVPLQQMLNASHCLTGIPCKGKKLSDHKYLGSIHDAVIEEEIQSEAILPTDACSDIDIERMQQIYAGEILPEIT